MRFIPYRCPKCGEPARALKAMMCCAVPLVLEKDTDYYEVQFNQLRRAEAPPRLLNEVLLMCGGGHEWDAVIVEEKK